MGDILIKLSNMEEAIKVYQKQLTLSKQLQDKVTFQDTIHHYIHLILPGLRGKLLRQPRGLPQTAQEV